MNPDMLTRLRDIQGLDEISWWPLAGGWWLLALLLIVLLFALGSLVRNLWRYPAGSWRRPAWQQLRTLRQQAYRMPAQQFAGELSELLRRIAIARLGRARAAGLSGERWLAWLQEHDPAGFDWSRHGRPLLTLPYAPPEQGKDNGRQLLPLLDAAFAWVDRNNGHRHV
ncbi:MAG: DUF4381 domain-containing protein [Thiogranum sp.]